MMSNQVYQMLLLSPQRRPKKFVQLWKGLPSQLLLKRNFEKTMMESSPVMTIRSVKILLVCNTDFFGKLAKIGQYLVSILGKSQYI